MSKLGISQVFAFSFIIVTIFVQGDMDSDNLITQNQENSEMTSIHDLTDKDLKLALSDLSLNDLKTLQAFIDSADYEDLDYQQNDCIIAKSDSLNPNNFDTQEFDNIKDFSQDQNDYDYEPKMDKDNFIYSQLDLSKFSGENQRLKRDDKKSNINEEYLKQLEYSFPQNKQLNNNNIQLKETHVRVKRN